MLDETRIDHRMNCQLITVPHFGLCTCDFDERKRLDDLMQARVTPFPGPGKIISDSNPS